MEEPLAKAPMKENSKTSVPWYHEYLTLLVGPGRESELPGGKTLQDVMRDYRPDVAEWSILPDAQALPTRPRGVATAAEWQEFPQDQNDLTRWLEIMNKPWTPTEKNGVDLTEKGVIESWKYGTHDGSQLYSITQFCPRYREFHVKDQLKKAGIPSVGVARQDNLTVVPGIANAKGGWGNYVLNAFRQWLKQRKAPGVLAAMGIADPDAGDMRAALLERRNLPLKARIEDALTREYILFLNAENLRFWREEVQAVAARFPDMPVGGNQGHGHLVPYSTILLSDAGHFAFSETDGGGYYIPERTLAYRLFTAGGRHRKPLWVWIWSAHWHNNMGGYKIRAYETWAAGAVPYLCLDTLIWTREKGYFHLHKISAAIYREGARLAQFAVQHRDLLRPAFRTEARVALVYSVPSFVFLVCGALDIPEKNEFFALRREVFESVARRMDEWHVPCNIEIFGHPDLWPDQNLVERLSVYDCLVLPDVAAVTDEQAHALRRFAGRGGKVVVIGELGTRDGNYAPRPEALVFSGISRADEEDEFKLSLAKYAIRTTAPPTVWIHVMLKRGGFQLHFFNRDLSADGNQARPSGPFTLEWEIPGGVGKPLRASWITADSESKAAVHIRDGRVIASVSGLEHWGFVSLRSFDGNPMDTTAT